MPRSWLAALALGVLALLTIFVMLPEDEQNLLDDPLASSSEEETDAEAVSVGEIPAESASNPEAAERAEIQDEAAPELASREFESYAGANGTLVKVLDKESGKPVASASLLVCLREEIEEDALEMALVSGTETLENIMHKYGHRYQTGADGTVMVQPLSDYPMLYARLGSRSGFAYQIEPGSHEIEVLLEHDLRMKIHVVDERGASVAKAPISLRMMSSDYEFTLFTRDADEQGVLVFRNMRPYMMSTIGGEDAHLELTVGALIDAKELNEQQKVVLDDDAFEAGEAELVLPPTGRVLVRTTLPNGDLFDGEGTVNLRSSESSSNGFGPRAGMSRPLVDGVAEFPHIVLGLDLIAEVFVRNAPGPDAGNGPGPTAAKQTTEIEIERTLRPVVRARLLDSSGEVLRETSFQIHMLTRDGGSRNNRESASRTDTEGWFAIELEARPADASLDYQRHVRLVHQDKDLTESEAKLDLSHLLRLGINDFGDLQLSPSAILLQGRVVDQFGEPIAQASVMLQQARLGRDNEVRGWRSINGLQTRSSADGRFVLQGELPDAQQFRLQVQAPKFETYEQTMQPAGQEVEVRLNPGSFISGSVLVDEGIDPSRMQLSFVEGEHNTVWVPLRPVAGAEGEASFEYQAHPDTPYAFVLQSEAGEILHEQPGVSTQRGETSAPPGLQPLDLRGRLRVIELKAIDTLGQPIDATFVLRATEDSWNSMEAKDGVLELSIAKELFEITVQHSKHASVTLQQVSQSQVIRLEPALEITVSIPQRYLGEESVQLSVQMYPEDRGRGRIYAAANRQEFNEQGHATLYAPQAGAYRVSLTLFYADGNQHRSRSVSAGTIQVSSHGSVHPLEIDVDRFEDAVTKLKQENQ
jgi:carboxypeptidase family protein